MQSLFEVFVIYVLQVSVEERLDLHVCRGQEPSLFLELLDSRGVFSGEIVELFLIVGLGVFLELFIKVEGLCEPVALDVYQLKEAFVLE